MDNWPGDGRWPRSIGASQLVICGAGDWVCRKFNWEGGAGNWQQLRGCRLGRPGGTGGGWWRCLGHGCWTNGAALVADCLK